MENAASNFSNFFHSNGVFEFNSIPAIHNQMVDRTANGMGTNWVKQARDSKDILRQAIRVNRIRKGKLMPIIDKSSTVPVKRRKPLQGDIPEETLLRREKNREAAKKCRLKKRQVLETLRKKIAKYKDRNRLLEKDIQNFKDEKLNLENLLQEHKCIKAEKQPQVETQSEQHYEESIMPPHNEVSIVSAPTAEVDIADSLEDLLSELQKSDCWCQELMAQNA